MRTSDNGIELIAKFEGFIPKPYFDAVGVPTIGFGNTYYPDGTKVKMSDPKITRKEGLKLLETVVRQFENDIAKVLSRELNQNQYDALVSFTYNLGIGNLRKSTLLKKINRNPCDPSIPDEFGKWVYAGGEILAGLVKRREEEAKLWQK